MNGLDLVLLAVILLASLRGFRRGALSQVAALGGALAGLLVGAAIAPRIASWALDGPSLNMALLTLAVLLGTVFLFQGIGFGIGLRLRSAAAEAGAAAADRAAGVAVGAAAVMLAIWLLGAAVAQGPLPSLGQQVRTSAVVGAIDDALPPPPDLFSQVAGYLDQQGFPQVFSGLGGATAPPVDPPSSDAVAAAQEAGAPSTVQVQATGCGGVSSGSGFVTQSGFVVTNAHVIAGGQDIEVRHETGAFTATPIHVDSEVDLAVLRTPDLGAPAIGWTASPAERDVQGATLGFPGGQRALNVQPARVRARGSAVGRDIYGRGRAEREVLTLSAEVRRGDSGGPFVTSDGQVAGVVFAAAPAEPGTGYALTAESVSGTIADAIAANSAVGTGACRF